MQEAIPSMTAYAVAMGLVNLSRQPKYEHLVPKESIDLLQLFIDEWKQQFKPWRRVYSTQLAAIVAPTTLGIEEYYVTRKIVVEQEVRRALREGAENVVNIGAGLDTLALRLSKEFPDVKFFEIDHPATQRVKREALKKTNYEIPDNLIIHPCDLSKTSLDRELLACGFNGQKKTVFIAEGLTIYLTRKEVVNLLTSLRKISPAGSRLIVGVAPATKLTEGDPKKLKALEESLAHAGEEYKFSESFQAVPSFMYENGFQVLRQATMAQLQSGIQPPKVIRRMLQAPEGENYFATELFDAQNPPPSEVRP